MKRYLCGAAAVIAVLCLAGFSSNYGDNLQIRSANGVPGQFKPVEFQINAFAKLSNSHIVWIAIDPNGKQWRCFADVAEESTAICNPE